MKILYDCSAAVIENSTQDADFSTQQIETSPYDSGIISTEIDLWSHRVCYICPNNGNSLKLPWQIQTQGVSE